LKKTSIVESRAISILLRVILWSSIVALIIVVFYIYHEGQWRDIVRFYRLFFDPRRLRVFISSFGPYASIVFVIVQSLQVVVAPIPGELTGFVGGLLFGKTEGLILSTIGLAVGSLIAFGIARTFGMGFVEKIVKKEYIDKFNYFVLQKGQNITFILFLLPGFPKDSLCYLLGLKRIRLVDFLFLNVFGRLPGTLMLTLQGNAVKNGKYQAFCWLLAGSIVLTAVLYFTRNRMIGFLSYMLHLLMRKKEDQKGDGDSVQGKDVQ
jgi:uncharacterized membrane protein YdjX (TVP38/TMEM64 family)